jgi:hypothetical protein
VRDSASYLAALLVSFVCTAGRALGGPTYTAKGLRHRLSMGQAFYSSLLKLSLVISTSDLAILRF